MLLVTDTRLSSGLHILHRRRKQILKILVGGRGVIVQIFYSSVIDIDKIFAISSV